MADVEFWRWIYSSVWRDVHRDWLQEPVVSGSEARQDGARLSGNQGVLEL